jgi:type I restriction enzyme, S subunit
MTDIPLPQGWAEQPLSRLVAKLESGVSVNAEDRACGADEIGVLKTSCVNGGQFDPRENKVVLDCSEIRRVELNPRRDSILISRMNTFDLVGECAYVDTDYPVVSTKNSTTTERAYRIEK